MDRDTDEKGGKLQSKTKSKIQQEARGKQEGRISVQENKNFMKRQGMDLREREDFSITRKRQTQMENNESGTLIGRYI